MKRQVKILGLSYSQTQIGSYVCVLSEMRGTRKLPIIIKPHDAQVIALSVEGMKSPRPLTHEILKETCDAFQMDCQEIEIYKVLEGIFYARILISNGFDSIHIDTTAGDAIAFSQIFDCPLYAQEEVLNMCGVDMDEQGNLVPDDDPKGNIMKVEDLEKLMEEAIENEDYEMAAELRDKINELKEKN